jgi:lactoylglutathione lyase
LWTAYVLTYNYGHPGYNIGDGFGRIGDGFGRLAVGMPDVYKACEEMRKGVVKITREPGPVKFGTTVRLRRGSRRLQDRADRKA